MARTLDKYPFGRLRVEGGYGKTHDRLAGAHFSNQKGPFPVFPVQGSCHGQNAPSDLGVKGRPQQLAEAIAGLAVPIVFGLWPVHWIHVPDHLGLEDLAPLIKKIR
jgi:hypothetical protein